MLDMIEDGFYDDFDPFDYFEIYKKYSSLGAQEILESLADLSVGNVDVKDPK